MIIQTAKNISTKHTTNDHTKRTNSMIKTKRLMTKLLKLVDPNEKYPVNYTVNQDGEKVFKRTWLLGKDLTENQLYDLYHFQFIR